MPDSKIIASKFKKLAAAFLFTSALLNPAAAFDNTNILVEEAVNHIYQQRYQQAHQVLKEAYEKSPRHPGVHFNLGRLFELTGNFSEALKEFRLAAALDTSMVAAKRGIARCTVELKRIKSVELQKQAQQARVNPAVSQTQTTQAAPSARIITQTPTQTTQPQQQPLPPIRQPATPKIVVQQPQPQRVEPTRPQNLRLPQLPELRTPAPAAKTSGEARAQQLLDSGKTDEAIKALNDALAINPDSAALHFLVGKALSVKGDLFGSIKHLEETLRVDEKYYDAYMLLGRNYARVNLLEDAIKNYLVYYGVKPQASIALEIARIYESMGDHSKAREFYSSANAMNPGNPNLQARLNETTGSLANDLFLRGNHAFSVENYDEAVSLFSQALETSGLLESYRRDALRKVEVARFKVKEKQRQTLPARQGFADTRQNYGTVNLLYPQLTDINFKTRFTGPVTVEWRGYVARRIKRYGRDFLLMIKELSQDELEAMRRDRNDFRLNRHFNNQPLFLLAARQGGFPPFAKEGRMITFTGSTDWKTYNVINDLGQNVSLPAFEFISAYPDPE